MLHKLVNVSISFAVASSTLVSGTYTIINDNPQLLDISTKAQVEDYIISRAMAYNYPVNKAVAIAKAESELVVSAQNPLKGSTASGLYQFINGTFQEYCVNKYALAPDLTYKNNPFVQIECAMKMLSAGGESHWNASKSVWSKSIMET